MLVNSTLNKLEEPLQKQLKVEMKNSMAHSLTVTSGLIKQPHYKRWLSVT